MAVTAGGAKQFPYDCSGTIWDMSHSGIEHQPLIECFYIGSAQAPDSDLMLENKNQAVVRFRISECGRQPAGRVNIQLICLVVAVAALLVGAWIYLISRPQHPGNMHIGAGSATTADIEMSSVVYATKDIPEGTVMSRDNMRDKQIPTSQLPQNVIGSINDADGRVAKNHVSNGQMICESDLAPKKRTVRKSMMRHEEPN